MELCKAIKFILLICCVAKIDAVTFTADESAVVLRSQRQLVVAATIAESMASNAYTEVLVASDAFKGKLSAAKEKVGELERKLLGESDDDAEGKAERISGAMGGIGDGLVGMIEGIKGGDWVQGVQGALGNNWFVSFVPPLFIALRHTSHAQFVAF